MSLTEKEHFKLYGRLEPAQIERLLDVADAASKAKSVSPRISEALRQFPAEDFMSPIVTQLHELQQRLRGDNKQKLAKIIEDMQDGLQVQFYASDYGRSELRQALKELE